ncbi:MAG: hypothetical protein ACXVCY_04980 [Pseudobdellovibrionaceae bacterium]
MKKARRLFFLALLTISFLGHNTFAASRFEKSIRSALQFLSHEQIIGNTKGYDPGQWRSQVTSYTPTAVGIGRFAEPFEEPTVFVTSSIANVLAETYEINPRYSEIPPMLNRAAEGLTNYRWGDLFNFYPWKTYHGIKIVGPRFMYLAPKIQGALYIPPDADTTAVTYTFLHYLARIERGRTSQTESTSLPSEVLNAYANFRDLNRKPHPFNLAQAQINTGAFLTWLNDENDTSMPEIFAPVEKGPRIPLHTNDVDCEVNANILKLLTYTEETRMDGYQASCRHLNNIAQQHHFFSCGLYYPSSYILPYTMAIDINAGALCLNPSKEQILSYLIFKQHNNGSWRNNLLARPDYIQSTLWALNAVMILADPTNEFYRRRVQRGIEFVMSQAKTNPRGLLYWPGEVFFDGPLISRFPIVWRSTAYTTALAVKALVLADIKWHLN